MTEFSNLQHTGVFEWIEEVPEGRNVVGGCIVCKEKLNELAKRKVHVIARGFSQVPGEDFTKNFMSVPRFTTLRILLAITAYHDFKLHQVDVVVAFLNRELYEEIYMEVLDGVCKFTPSGSSGRYWRLKKLLYGLKQSPRQWRKKLDKVMEILDFMKSIADNFLYFL